MRRLKNQIPIGHFLFNLKQILIRWLYSEYFTDALRISLTIITPVIILFMLGDSARGLGIGVGALVISLTDIPGNRGEKFKTACISIALFTGVSLITSFSLSSFTSTGITIVVLTFLSSMLAIFGNRMALIGLMCTALAIFILGLKPANPIQFSLNIFFGSTWYYLISIAQIYLFPYKSIKHAIYECLAGTASLLALRAKAYNENITLEDFENQNILLQLKLNARQEVMRTLLIGDTQLMRKNSAKVKRLLNIARDVIDLYEQVSAIHQDYDLLQKQLKEINALELVHNQILSLSKALENYSIRFLSNEKSVTIPVLNSKFNEDYTKLKAKIEAAEFPEAKRVFNNVESVATLIKHIDKPKEQEYLPNNQKIEYLDFLSKEEIKAGDILSQFSIHSPIFRFALRLSFLCFIAIIINYFVPAPHYTYWLLLTIIIVNRPSFGLTRKRNLERLKGTVYGLIISFALLKLNAPYWLQLVMAGFGLLGFFTFNRLKYPLSVLCITVMVIMGLNVYHGSPLLLIGDRLAFTLMGCLLSFLAAYMFPIWESKRIRLLISESILANRDYLYSVIQLKNGALNLHQTKLARKLSYLKFASLTEGLESLKKEPQSARIDMMRLAKVQALCYQINGHIAGLSFNNDLNYEKDDFSKNTLEVLDSCAQMSLNLKLNSKENKLFERRESESIPILSKLVLELQSTLKAFN